MTFLFEPIGVIRSCFKEKFGVPRQPGLVPDACAVLEMAAPYDREEAFEGLISFSHLWVVFVFHENLSRGWRSTVRPPRLGGNQRVGVFATRSGFRPNPLGISVVKLDSICKKNGRIELNLKGVDLMEGTPVIDIKPYLPYADAICDAIGGFAQEPPASNLSVKFSVTARRVCTQKEAEGYPDLARLITQVLQQDPRPAYHARRPCNRIFGISLFDLNIKWTVNNYEITILSLHEKDATH
jgi:tRNA (adenine37-N6)-methyltransferase